MVALSCFGLGRYIGHNNNNNNGPFGGQMGLKKSDSSIAGFVVQGWELRMPKAQVMWENTVKHTYC